jgi:receptor expression-enhancing protein 5/6
MGIVVLTLRCYLVFQNVFITFKTLKPPPPSSRNNGQPSVRGLTQRKRDMKGCMAIWIVWVSRVTLLDLDCYEGVPPSAAWRFMNQSWSE